MRVYTNRFPNLDEGDDDFTLTLGDDGHFTLDVLTANYAWSSGTTAKGRWELAGTSLTLHVEEKGWWLDAGETLTIPFSEDQVVIKKFDLSRQREVDV